MSKIKLNMLNNLLIGSNPNFSTQNIIGQIKLYFYVDNFLCFIYKISKPINSLMWIHIVKRCTESMDYVQIAELYEWAEEYL